MTRKNKATLSPAQQKRAIIADIRKRVKPFKNADGKIPKTNAYLKTPAGKEILELVLKVGIREVGWPEVEKLLCRSKRSVCTMFSHWNLDTNLSRTCWTDERIALVKKRFQKSRTIRDLKNLALSKDKLLKDVNDLRGRDVSWNAVMCLAREYSWKQWGMTSGQKDTFDLKIVRPICTDTQLSPEERRKKIVKMMPHYSSRDALFNQVRKLGFDDAIAITKKPARVSYGIEKTISEYCTTEIDNGILVGIGLDELYKAISEKFGKEMKEADFAWNKKVFNELVDEIVWKGDPDKALQEVVRMRLDPEVEFTPLFPHIPSDMVVKRMKWHRGVSRVRPRNVRTTLPGIGRIRASKDLGDLDTFKMPSTSFAYPFVFPTENIMDNFSVMFLNGANIGTRYGADMMGNVVRRALADAEHRGDCAIIATNIISLDLKKAAGPIKVGRALAMGDNINPEIITDPEYRKRVEQILKDNPTDEVIYQTAEELLDNVLSGWSKICIKPNNASEYSGPVYVVLGVNEEELIRSVAYWEMNYWTKRQQNDLQSKLRIANLALTKAQSGEAFDGDHINELTDKVASLQEQLNRTVVSNIATQELQRFYSQARALVVRKIENAIPNAHVIGQGTTHVKIGDEIVEINIPSHSRVTDRLLAHYTGQYGPKNLRETLAGTVVICGPWSLNFRMTVREVDTNGKRGSSKVFTAPIVVDEGFLRSVLSNVVAQAHPLAKAVFSEQFRSGVLRLRSTNGIFDADVISSASLDGGVKRKRSNKKTVKKVSDVMSFYENSSKYLWVFTGTDPHEGGRSKEFVTCKETGRRFGMSDAVFEMMRREGVFEGNNVPVHIFGVNDDPVQGQNFPARTQLHPHQMHLSQTVEESRRLLERVESARTVAEARERAKELHMFNVQQGERRGTDNMQEQMWQMLDRFIKPNMDALSAVLRRSQDAGVILKGVGEFVNPQNKGFDTRNVGLINIGSGNHFQNTIGGELFEGPFYATWLRHLLLALPEWHGKDEFIERSVIAPSYSGEAIAWGTVKVGRGGYEYGLELRSTPARMSGWSDPLLGAVNNDPQRGNYSRIFNGRMTLKTYGDKHFFSAVSTSHTFYHMSAAGTTTDRYGERGFPPNNTGVSFVGLPIDGPDSGPILLRILPYDVIRDFMDDNPRPFSWETFLPNPA